MVFRGNSFDRSFCVSLSPSPSRPISPRQRRDELGLPVRKAEIFWPRNWNLPAILGSFARQAFGGFAPAASPWVPLWPTWLPQVTSLPPRYCPSPIRPTPSHRFDGPRRRQAICSCPSTSRRSCKQKVAWWVAHPFISVPQTFGSKYLAMSKRSRVD